MLLLCLIAYIMSFESKKIIEFGTLGTQTKNFLWNIFQLFGMFCLGVLFVFATLKGYSFLIQQGGFTKIADKIPVKVSTAQKQEDQVSSIVNGLIVWVWGKGHRGAYNTDTMIVVSYNPSTKQLNMISLPRDLYVNIDKWYYWRINGILDYYMSAKDLSLSGAMEKLSEKIGNLVGQNIHYYWLIDFHGFEDIIDTLGWLKVNVPEELYDPTFPVDNFNYGILHIDSGSQTMDGNTALNYARSRHSTSDFDRSRRQQIIIHALIDKLLSFGWITKIKPLYDQFKTTVVTNAGLTDLVKYLPYATKIKNMNNIVFQSDCPANINQIRPWCVLYSPWREAFGGAAVLLPIGATPTNVSNYGELFQFVNRIIYYPFGQFNSYNLVIYNSIDPNLVQKPVAWLASQLGVELVRNWLMVDHVKNNQTKLANTMIVAANTGIKPAEIAEYTSLVEDILNIPDIQIMPREQLDSIYSGESLSGSNTDILLLIGSDVVLKNPKK